MIDWYQIFYLIIVMVMAASVAGFAAGLLGVGGGLVMVPALYYAFTVLDFEMATKMHLALGTSLAIIIPTSIMSTRTHMKFNAVDFGLIKSFGIYIVLGVIIGTLLASNLKDSKFSIIFLNFCIFGGFIFLIFKIKIRRNRKKYSKDL